MEAKDLYEAKVAYYDLSNRERHSQLYETRHYTKLSSAIQDVIDGSVELFDNVPQELQPKEFNNPVITYGGVDSVTGWATDFEFRYYLDDAHKKQLIVWLGTVLIEDEKRR